MAFAMILLPLNSRSGADLVRFFRRLTAFAFTLREGGRPPVSEGDSKGKRERVREGGILLLLLKLPDLEGALARRSVSGKA